jgi:hypothetical protein
MEALLAGNASSSHGTLFGENLDDLIVPTSTSSVDADANTETSHEASAIHDEGLESSALPTTLFSTETIENLTGSSDSLLSIFPPSIPGAHLTKVDIDSFRDNLLQRLPRMQIFAPLPPTFEIFSIVEAYLDDMNAFLPIFHPQSLRILCRRGMTKSKNPDPLWWACINAVLATTIQSRSTDEGFPKVSEFSWAFFKNAFSVYDHIITSEPSVLGLQVLLNMAAYIGRTSDLKLALLLSSTCVHMAQVLGLNTTIDAAEFTHEEAEQRRRLIWITFIIDTLMKTKAGEPLILNAESITVGMPDQAPADQLSCYKVSGTGQTVNLLNLMIEITIIRSGVYNHLKSSSICSPTTHDFIVSTQSRISTWTLALPIDYRPDGTVMVLDLSILVLHLAYYDCMAVFGTLINESTVSQQSNDKSMAGMSSLRQETVDIKDQRAHLGRSVIDLSRSCNAIPFVYLWLVYSSCAIEE